MKSFFSIAMVVTLIVTTVTVTSCEKGDTKNREQCEKLEQNGYSLTVCGGKNGTANITSEPFRDYDLITLTATANNGYRFVEWHIIIDGITVSSEADNPVTFGMSSDFVSTLPHTGSAVWEAIFVPLVVLPDSIIVSQYSNASSDNIYRQKHKYQYDSRNRISQGIMYNHFYLTYNDEGDLIEYESCYISSRCTRAKFSKNGNNITFTTDYHPTVSLFGTVNGELELNAQGLPVKLTYKEEAQQGYEFIVNTTTHAVVSLTWQNENLTKKEWESESIIEEKHWSDEESVIKKESTTGTVTYMHDDKKNPFYLCNTPKGFFWWLSYDSFNDFYGYNKNNIKNERREDGSTITYEYTYNDNGFPVTRTWESALWNEIITETYTYY